MGEALPVPTKFLPHSTEAPGGSIDEAIVCHPTKLMHYLLINKIFSRISLVNTTSKVYHRNLVQRFISVSQGGSMLFEIFVCTGIAKTNPGIFQISLHQSLK